MRLQQGYAGSSEFVNNEIRCRLIFQWRLLVPRARVLQKRVKQPWTAVCCSLLCLVKKSKCQQTSPNMIDLKTLKSILLIAWQQTVTDLDVFGSEVDFVHPNTQAYLEDHIWEALQENRHFTIVFRDCVEAFQTKEDADHSCAH